MSNTTSAPERPPVPALIFGAQTPHWASLIGTFMLPAMRSVAWGANAPAWVIYAPRTLTGHLYVTVAEREQNDTVGPQSTELLTRLVQQFADPATAARLRPHGGVSYALGNVTPIWPSGSFRLAQVRDQLHASLLPVFAPFLIRHHDRPATMLAYAGLTLALVHRIRWADQSPLWPMSLYGQVRAARHHHPDLAEILLQHRAEFLPKFATALAQSRYLAPDFIPSRREACILDAFQQCYDAVHSIIGGWTQARIREQAGDVSHHLSLLMPEVEEDFSALDDSGAHLSFRVFMTMLYDSLPIFDIGTARRILLFDTLLRASNAVSPGIFDRTAKAGRALVLSGTTSH